ncbi:MAG: radical SAM protein [Phycisphaerales bacterium]|jgi:cyclic dehypoxanthinyl futalosine synthase|nr:radical SAM protein [Phycisphaerales bacterium]
MNTLPAGTPREYPNLDALDHALLRAVVAGEARLTSEQALELFNRMPFHELGRWADARCRELHGDSIRTYIIDRNINYTNVCNARCTFCAFRRDAGDADAYVLPKETIHEKIAELAAIGGTQILMQGGMNPDLPLDYYLDLLGSIREKFPAIHVHAFSPPEMIEFVHFFNPPGATLFDKCRWVLTKLRDAGLHSLPGGGGEIFAAPVRRKIGLGKCDAEAWLTVMYAAHSLGMFTSATMMFGHIEGYADRVHHMWLVREWQDKALRVSESEADHFGHYKAFIAWPFQRENTPLGRVKHWGAEPAELACEFPGDVVARGFAWGANPEVDYRELGPDAAEFGRRVRMSGSSDYLRTQALSRLFLDNIYSIGASWVTMGPHVGQMGLAFGASDMGSVMMEENVVSSAGTTYCLDEAVLCRLIRESGFVPAQRNNTYDVLRVHDGPSSPDRLVTDWSTHRAKRTHQEAPRQSRASVTISATT